MLGATPSDLALLHRLTLGFPFQSDEPVQRTLQPRWTSPAFLSGAPH
jgi:hypothetical protein